MSTKRESSESGQALVLLALAFVALLGFVALAIDGGMVYSNRRHAQNASDAASMAGGGTAALYLENHFVDYENWNCSDPSVIAAQGDSNSGAVKAAINLAISNDYEIDDDISDDNGVDTNCGVVDNGSYFEKFIDIRTLITADTPTSFIQFVYPGPLRNTVESVARVWPRTPLAFANAMVALSESCDNGTGGVNFVGTSGSNVTGGGVFSNACVTANGSASISLEPGHKVACVGAGCASKWSPASGPTPQVGTYTLPEEVVTVPPPDCTLVPNRGSHTGGGTIDPGRYSEIRVNSVNDSLFLKPGLYCVSNGLKMNGGSIKGYNITIYLTGGDFDVSGSNLVDLSAPPARDCTICPPAIPGVLVYLDENNTGEASLLGSSDNSYLGVVYAPGGTVEVGGTAGEVSEIDAQLIGSTVNIHGTAELVINFDGGMVFQIPSRLELSK